MPDPCTLSDQDRQKLLSLLNEFDRARRDLHDQLGEIADRWDDQLADHPGNTQAEDRLERLIRWRDDFGTEITLPNDF